MQADDGNDASDFGIGISEVRSLCGVDITGWAASLLTFLGGLACHGRSNQLVGGSVMSLLTGGQLQFFSRNIISKSAPPSAMNGERAAREVSLKREKLLRTRQEVYHPLQEVCPLDRANLL